MHCLGFVVPRGSPGLKIGLVARDTHALLSMLGIISIVILANWFFCSTITAFNHSFSSNPFFV
jgi:hypothetical protein